jgi:signal transduction histidine kinase/ActR/RegA family two-component response regulator
LKLAVSRGFEHLRVLEAGESRGAAALWQQAMRSERCTVVSDIQRDQHNPMSASEREEVSLAGYRGVVSAPLRTRGNAVLGVLSAYFRDPHSPSERELRVIDLFARLASDLIERLRSEEKLTRLLRAEQSARSTLDQSVHMKDEFLATLSHELRTPLNVILLWSRVLRDAPDDVPDKAGAVEAILRSAKIQARLIEDLLDSSRIVSGKLRLDMQPTDLTQVVHSAIEAILPTAAAKGVHIEQSLEDVGVAMVDGERMHQVVWNLLNNAVKFTAKDGLVRVEMVREGDKAIIRVTDTGMGIAPEFLPHLFDRFRQFGGRSQTGSGLGLGLAISKQLVELHGGTIEAASPGRGKGATFTIRLSLPEQDDAASSKPSKAVPTAEQRLDGVRVLLVEDEAATNNVLRLLLKRAGATVRGASSGEEALAAYQKSRPDVIVSDIGLPDLDGYDLIRRIRSLEASENERPVPAIALTAYALDRDRHEARQAGFQLHLAKPVQEEFLLRAIRRLVEA